MSRSYVGDPVLVDYYLEDAADAPVDATVATTAVDPDGSTVSTTAGHPGVGHFTFLFQAAKAGVYTGVNSATGAVTDVTPWAVQVWPAAARLWLPTPAQVHALIPMRCQGGFTNTSTPSIDEVNDIIDQAADSVASETILDFPTAMAGKVRFVVSLLAASLVESAFFPEQQMGPDDPARLLMERYTAELLGLRTLLSRSVSDGQAFTITPYGEPDAVLIPGFF